MDKLDHELLLGIDIGGTAIKVGLFSHAGRLLAQESISTPALVDDRAYAVVADALTELLAERGFARPDVAGIGIDIPGPVREDGSVGFLPNIELDVEGLKTALSSAFSRAAIATLNDANAAAFGELWQGSAKGERSFVFVTLGTGVGGGVVIDGKLVRGKHGAGGEIGHITVNPHEKVRACGCGRLGCLEEYASATGLVRLYQEACERGGTVACDTADGAIAVFQALARGDEAAKAALSQMCEYLAIAFAHMSCVIDPGAFVIGGGVSASFDVFADELAERFRAHALPMCAETKIIRASLGNEAGIYGAAYQALLATATGK
ncbi:MAG: ROK family protein [Atopobiaceae bacterium]|jgi:glucokinase